MLKVFENRLKNERGFTLIELLAVLVILAVIAAIAIPMIGGIIKNSKADAEVATARSLYEASRLYIIGEAQGKFEGASVTLKQLEDTNYIDKGLKNSRTGLDIGSTVALVKYNTDGKLDYVQLAADIFYAADIVISGKGKHTTTAPKTP